MSDVSPIRVMVVDDHPLMCAGLAAILASEPDIEVVAIANSGEQAIDLFRLRRPHITVMDLRLPGINGPNAMIAIREIDPAARLIALSNYEGDEDIRRIFEIGGSGYLIKSSAPGEVVKAIRDVHAGKHFLPAAVALRLAEQAIRVELTPRETDVLRLVATGQHNKEIAFDLGVAESTVKDHLKNIFGKLHASDRVEAVMIALRRGILHLG